jgi:hypothetical protein
MLIYSGYSCSTMDKDIPSFEAGIYELECFLEMGSHSITG